MLFYIKRTGLAVIVGVIAIANANAAGNPTGHNPKQKKPLSIGWEIGYAVELDASGVMARASYPIFINNAFIKPIKTIALCVVGCGITIPLNATHNKQRAAIIGLGVITGWVQIWRN